MKRIVSLSEIVDSAKSWEGTWELCATAEASFDEAKSRLTVELDCRVRPAGSKVSGRLAQDWLPRQEVVRETVALAEALPAAQEIFRRWVGKVRRSVPAPLKP